jgi:glyoxylase-like metal-dependent hydrolase (beta-lactamase superfamily II)
MSPTLKSFHIGDLRCHVIDDGVSTYATAAFLFASAPKEDRDRLLRERGEDPDAIRCSNACLLIESADGRILVDTGSGALARSRKGRENLGQLFVGLNRLGVRPEDIGLVILTHLHSDHVWGCFGPDGREPVFSAARLVVRREEWEGMHPTLADDLKHLEPLVDPVDGQVKVAPGITLLSAPGHSPGHSAVLVSSDSEHLLCVGDAVAHELNLTHPDWTMAHEETPSVAVRSRRQLLDRAVDQGMLVHAFHMPFPSLGRIRAKGEAYAWEKAHVAERPKEGR